MVYSVAIVCLSVMSKIWKIGIFYNPPPSGEVILALRCFTLVATRFSKIEKLMIKIEWTQQAVANQLLPTFFLPGDSLASLCSLQKTSIILPRFPPANSQLHLGFGQLLLFQCFVLHLYIHQSPAYGAKFSEFWQPHLKVITGNPEISH